MSFLRPNIPPIPMPPPPPPAPDVGKARAMAEEAELDERPLLLVRLVSKQDKLAARQH